MAKSKELGLKARLRETDGEERGAILESLPYAVGFGKPPQSTRFAVGNQAGRRGRPKGSENLDIIVREEFDAKVEVTESGKPRKLSKRRIAMRQLANKAASGDLKSLALYLEFLRKTGQLGKVPPAEDNALSGDDLQAAADLMRFYEPTRNTQDSEKEGKQ
jgi:hypothetical protein